jgi:predicted metal-binding membrane protein
MGLVHGAYCLGCCWFLMALLFFGGVMNLWWIGGLAAYVLLEKLLPAGHWLGYAVGAGWSAGALGSWSEPDQRPRRRHSGFAPSWGPLINNRIAG